MPKKVKKAAKKRPAAPAKKKPAPPAKKKPAPPAKKKPAPPAKKKPAAPVKKKPAAPVKKKPAAPAKKKPAPPAKQPKPSRSRRDVKLGDNAVLRKDGSLELRMELTEGMVAALEADAAVEAGNFLAAIQHLDAALAADGPNAHYLVSRGQARYQLGDHALAIVDYEHALALKPDYADLHFEKGKAELRALKYADAEDSFTRDLSVGDPSPISYFNRHVARKSQGNIGGALADLDAALEQMPDSPQLRLARLDLRSQDGNLEGAMADANLAVAAQPDDTELRDRRARLAFAKADYARAASDFRHAIDVAARLGAPPSDEWFAGAGTALGQLGHYEEAIEFMDRAVELRPDEPKHHCNRGWIRHLAGDSPAALVDLDRAIDLNPAYAKAIHNRAVARIATGDNAGALTDYARLRQLGHPVDAEIAALEKKQR